MKKLKFIKHTGDKLLGSFETSEGPVRVYETVFCYTEVRSDPQRGESGETKRAIVTLIETPDGETHGAGKFADGLVSAWLREKGADDENNI